MSIDPVRVTGWAVAVGGGVASLFVAELTGSIDAAAMVLAAGCAGGFAMLAFGFVGDRTEPAGHDRIWLAAAWMSAAALAFVAFLFDWPGNGPLWITALARAEPPETFLRFMRLLETFGALGGLLSVVVAAGRRIRVSDAWRGILAGLAWSVLVPATGVVVFFTLYVGLAVGPAGLMVAAPAAVAITGLFLGALGGILNRLTLKPAA